MCGVYTATRATLQYIAKYIRSRTRLKRLTNGLAVPRVHSLSLFSLRALFFLFHSRLLDRQKRLSQDDLALRLTLTPVREEFSGTGRPKRISRGLAIDGEYKSATEVEKTTGRQQAHAMGRPTAFVSTLSHKVGGGYLYVL